MIEFDRITVMDAKAKHPELWETAKVTLALDDNRTALIVSLVIGICGDCHEAELGCQCWNDE